MRSCPECLFLVERDAKYCPSCGLILKTAKAPAMIEQAQPAGETIRKKRKKKRPRTPDDAAPRCGQCGIKLPAEAHECPACDTAFSATANVETIKTNRVEAAPRRRSRTKVWVALALSATAVLAVNYFFSIAGTTNTPEAAGDARQLIALKNSSFDRAIETGAQPSGLVWTGRYFFTRNYSGRGFIVVDGSEGKNKIKTEGSVTTRLLAWNGKELIGYSKSGTLISKHRFKTYDATNYRLLAQFPAPGPIGGLAWDGTGYWAAARIIKNSDQAFLYRLNREFVPVNKMAAPSNSCAGLAWDGSFLYLLDDLARKVIVLDVKGITARTMRSFNIELSSANGIAFDGDNIWISDSAQKRLFRLKPIATAKRS